MKSKFFFPALLLALLIISCSPKAAKPMEAAAPAAPAIPYLGDWTYTVPGTPLGDVTGKMILKSDNGVIKAFLETNGETTELSEFKLEDKNISGIFYYSGTPVRLEGVFESPNSLTGKLTADGAGVFAMKASR